MSHSYRKHCFYSFHSYKSQKEDKRLGNRRLRRNISQLLLKWGEVDEDLVLPILDEILNKYDMPKDGDSFYYPFRENLRGFERKVFNCYGKELSLYIRWFLAVMRK